MKTRRRIAMRHGAKHGINAFALAVALSALSIAIAAKAEEAKKYPDWNTLWNRGSPPGVWDPSKPRGLGQEAPLTAEYQKVYEQNLAKDEAGLDYDPKATCGPVGMPRLMIVYEPIEIVITPKVVYMLAESMSPIRRIFTDGRDWPKDPDPSFVGYSIGKWIDSANSGTYDTLEIETRYMKGPRLMEGSGIPLASDNKTVVKEKLYLDPKDPNILRNEITTYDSAFTRPWTVSRFMKRAKNPTFEEYNCTEDNHWLVLGGYLYMTDGDGYVMPVQKNEPAPDIKYFRKYFKEPKTP
jgi:hypothetical protein